MNAPKLIEHHVTAFAVVILVALVALAGASGCSTGVFFEGAITSGCPDGNTVDAIQANVVAAGYGK